MVTHTNSGEESTSGDAAALQGRFLRKMKQYTATAPLPRADTATRLSTTDLLAEVGAFPTSPATTTSTAPRATATPDLIAEIERVDLASADEAFEDGMHNSVSRAVQELCPLHGAAFVDAVSELHMAGRLRPSFVAEVLLWLGAIETHSSHESRFWFFVLNLEDSDPQIRSAAAVALEALEDRRATKYMRKRAGVEPIGRLKERLETAVRALDQTVPKQ